MWTIRYNGWTQSSSAEIIKRIEIIKAQTKEKGGVWDHTGILWDNCFSNNQGIIPLLPITVLKLQCHLVWISVSRLYAPPWGPPSACSPTPLAKPFWAYHLIFTALWVTFESPTSLLLERLSINFNLQGTRIQVYWPQESLSGRRNKKNSRTTLTVDHKLYLMVCAFCVCITLSNC